MEVLSHQVVMSITFVFVALAAIFISSTPINVQFLKSLIILYIQFWVSNSLLKYTALKVILSHCSLSPCFYGREVRPSIHNFCHCFYGREVRPSIHNFCHCQVTHASHNITRTSEWVSEWALCGDHVNCFCVRIFHESAGRVKYPDQK